ncbi:protein-disulfide reductase DsbD family protein [Dichotomicrobium thermohalophilum]|uniref:Thiol:disulfide interchange protein DsbD n=1 Tax=Dichotomicrobium thermohalophilum TaxID=933063 RepID=A0A397Q757_9HYPH|nr:protein-disulfide reductase DsbD domain-containing protein [Dichotomicrobium thermohalophilum]RIA56912.1 thiol:disulfide interchange protein DsbD [Dichotomicrobium thermohalophilum]
MKGRVLRIIQDIAGVLALGAFALVTAGALHAQTGSSTLETLVQGQSTASSTPQRADRKVQIDLLSETAAIRPGQTFWVALRQKIAPGWHTYWENPGDSGEPTRIDWTLPEGFAVSDIHWPPPKAIPYGTLMNYGYADEALLLVQITPPEGLSAEKVTLRAESRWLVCEEICIPEDGKARLTLAVAGSGAPLDPGKGADKIAAAVRDLPMEAPWPVKLTVAPDKLALTAETDALRAEDVAAMRFFPRDWGLITNAAPQELDWQNGTPRLVMMRGERKDQPVEKLNGVLTLTAADGTREAYNLSVSPAETVAALPAASSGAAPGGLSLWHAAAFAFLGGLILNFFPCVFPVLSMKALSLARGGDGAHGNRHHALAYLGGVMLSFAVLAGLLLALRATGAAFGWGFQFQSPWFVLVMAALFFALGLSLSGVFNFGGALMGVGDSLTRRSGASGSFFTGVLASIAATPCTAPFMGAALGYAVTQPAVEATTVIMVLGLGFAAPMTLLSLSGAFARLLPKPGPWMETLKQVLAFPLYATVVWLVWVLSLQTGADGVLGAGAVLIAVGFAAWLVGMTQASRAFRYTVSAAVVIVTFSLAGPMVDFAQDARQGESRTAASAEVGEPFSVARLEELRAQGRPVFVNFTAAWCITCKVNEEVALNSDAFQEALKRGNIAYLVGDWTNQDPEISQMLEKFGRAGVPLYLLYSGNGEPPRVLPQILTEGFVLRQLDDVGQVRKTQR